MRLCTALKDNVTENGIRNQQRSALANYVRLPECKRLVNRIYTAQRAKNLKSIVVLSQFPEDGNTTFISSVALGFLMLLNKRVLIMDTVSQTRDESFYYRKVLQKTSSQNDQSEDNLGFIDLITTRSIGNQFQIEDFKNKAPTVKNTNPIHYDSADFQVAPFVETLKANYDLILLDTCPLTEVNQDCFDPLILALYADASIVVTSPDSMEKGTMATLTEELKRNQVTPLGFVVNSGAI